MKNPGKNIARKITQPRVLWKIWFFFAIIFFGLGLFHLTASTSKIESFKATKLQTKEVDVEFATKYSGVDIEAPLRNFVNDFNKYLKNLNNHSRNQNIFAAIGYGAACLTAILAMVIEIERAKLAKRAVMSAM